MLQIIHFINFLKADNTLVSSEPGVIETPVEGFNYIPGVFNDNIGLQNVIVRSDKLIMRSTIDDSSMIRWEVPVPEDNWSFIFDFNELNLESRESAGLYLFYTKDKQTLGNYKGGTSEYHGFMAGIEFLGKTIELNYAKNEGEDFRNIAEFVTKVDSLNPNRFVNVTSLRLKIINTKNNFKIEIYDKEKLLYDNFRFFGEDDLSNSKKGYYISIFAEYRHVSSGKAFELRNAILNKRVETKEYSTSLIRMEKIENSPKNKSDIQHTNTEVNELIFKISALTSYTKAMLGDLPETAISNVEKELTKEIEMITSKLDKLAGLKSRKRETSNFISNLNVLDLKLKGLERLMNEVEYHMEHMKETQNKKFSIFESIAIFSSSFVVLILGIRELQNFLENRKVAKN